jgi:hypothetical protein
VRDGLFARIDRFVASCGRGIPSLQAAVYTLQCLSRVRRCKEMALNSLAGKGTVALTLVACTGGPSDEESMGQLILTGNGKRRAA